MTYFHLIEAPSMILLGNSFYIILIRCLSIINTTSTSDYLRSASSIHKPFKTVRKISTSRMRQVGRANYSCETRNSAMIRRTHRKPHGLLLHSSKSKAFLTFLIPQLVPQLRRCKAGFRRCGILRHLTFLILLISMCSAVVMSVYWFQNHRRHYRHDPERHHHGNEARTTYSHHMEPNFFPAESPVSTKESQRWNADMPGVEAVITSQSATMRKALSSIEITRLQKHKQKLSGRRRHIRSSKRMQQRKAITSEKLRKDLENDGQDHQRRRSLKNLSNRWSGHLDIENGTLRSVPFTRWHYDKDPMKFTPPKQRMTDVRLISLKDACFCTKRNKFVVPKRSMNKTRFPGFFYRYGAAKTVPWEKPISLLASRNQTVNKLSGRTILWRGRSLSLYQQHLQGSLIAIRSLIDILSKKKGGPIYIAAESLTEHGKNDIRTKKLHDYYLGDVSAQRRIELKELRPKMICFDQVYALGSEFENHAMSHESYEHVKELVQMSEKDRLHKSLVRSCTEEDANKKTIWIMEKQQENGHYGSITNVAEVRIAVDHEIIRAGLAKTVTAKVVQAPNILCPKGSAREGCMDLNCAKGYSKEDCMRSVSMLSDVVGFNNMTFLITTSGPANNGFVYMPRGSHIVEVAPFGVYDHAHEIAAMDAGMDYHRIGNHGDRKLEERLYERFGDVARSPRTCWADFECRSVRMNRATVIDVPALKFILKRALSKWKKSCHVR